MTTTHRQIAWTDYCSKEGLIPGPGTELMKFAFFAGWDAASPNLPVSAVGWWSDERQKKAAITPEQIYQAYPRKVGKSDALRAIEKALKANLSAEFLLEMTKEYAAAVSKWSVDDQRFVPFPATWFNRGSYSDDVAEWVRDSRMPHGRIDHRAIRATE